jgi:hypothetical protein
MAVSTLSPEAKAAVRPSLWSLDENGNLTLPPHRGQAQAWASTARIVAIVSGTQGGKTSWGPWWLYREIMDKTVGRGPGDYLAVTSSYDLFKLKMLPEILDVFERVLQIGRYWAGDGVIEIMDPETGKFLANRASDKMWARIILRSASSGGGLESATALAAWLDEAGQDAFQVGTWEAILRRLSLSRGRVLISTTPYNLGWLKQQVYDKWRAGDPDYDVIQFDSIMNPRFPQEEFERARRDLPAWKFNMFYRGRFTRPAGMIYNDYIDEDAERGGHLVKPFSIPADWARYVGIDFGGVHTATIWLASPPPTVSDDPITGAKSSRRESIISTARLWKATKRPESTPRRPEASGRLSRCLLVRRRGVGGAEPARLASGRRSGPPAVGRRRGSGIDAVIGMLRTRRLFIFDTMTGVRDELGSYSRKLDRTASRRRPSRTKPSTTTWTRCDMWR